MKTRPILFTAAMVRAVLDGTKTQTRRVIKPQPVERGVVGSGYVPIPACPYGVPGDRLWVRETFRCVWAGDGSIEYRADGKVIRHGITGGKVITATPKKWKPSIFMPRWASRIDLEVVAVRVERVQDITSSDALAEGIQEYSGCENQHDMEAWDPVDEFRKLWDSINGKRPGCSWNDNPFVWVVAFKRVRP